ncbi:hypothetical protein BDW02DRAFT_603233 [Decorospora gaudefroyi]|uniref:Uncharacterized protein n=1 Tax=Decorospora gaudefroyi TaxID=184978 RepID=A0A6A5JVX2_9PLEO|nr:hypothetical protein BDW02DRAFT_603233 [Decorospora gaudefroyi]
MVPINYRDATWTKERLADRLRNHEIFKNHNMQSIPHTTTHENLISALLRFDRQLAHDNDNNKEDTIEIPRPFVYDGYTMNPYLRRMAATADIKNSHAKKKHDLTAALTVWDQKNAPRLAALMVNEELYKKPAGGGSGENDEKSAGGSGKNNEKPGKESGGKNKKGKHRLEKKFPNASPGGYSDPAQAWNSPAYHQVYEEVYSETETEESRTNIEQLGADGYLKRKEKQRIRDGNPEPEVWDGTDNYKEDKRYNNLYKFKSRRKPAKKNWEDREK